MSNAPHPSSLVGRSHVRAIGPDRGSVPAEAHRRHSRDDRLARLRVFAALRATPPVFSHWSAALIHGLPLPGDAPNRVEILSRGGAERSARGLVEHASSADPVFVTVRGLRTTPPARTVAELAGCVPFAAGVVMADFILSAGRFGERRPLSSPEELMLACQSVRDEPRRRRAIAVAAFADGRAHSPLQSMSRATLAAAGAPAPELAVHIHDLASMDALLDFVWPALGLAGERDTGARSLHPSMHRGRTTAEVVADARERDEAIRAMGLEVIRWTAQTAGNAARMRELLAAHGMPLARDTPGLQHRVSSGKLV